VEVESLQVSNPFPAKPAPCIEKSIAQKYGCTRAARPDTILGWLILLGSQV